MLEIMLKLCHGCQTIFQIDCGVWSSEQDLCAKFWSNFALPIISKNGGGYKDYFRIYYGHVWDIKNVLTGSEGCLDPSNHKLGVLNILDWPDTPVCDLPDV